MRNNFGDNYGSQTKGMNSHFDRYRYIPMSFIKIIGIIKYHFMDLLNITIMRYQLFCGRRYYFMTVEMVFENKYGQRDYTFG